MAPYPLGKLWPLPRVQQIEQLMLHVKNARGGIYRGTGGYGDPDKTFWWFLPGINLSANASFIAKWPRSLSNNPPYPNNISLRAVSYNLFNPTLVVGCTGYSWGRD